MATPSDCLRTWLTDARRRLAADGIGAADLDALEAILDRTGRERQRLLYLHAQEPGIHAAVLAFALHEPSPNTRIEVHAEGEPWPYASVHAAILDGWRVIHFPDQRAPFDDGEIDVLGFEFILEKWEARDDAPGDRAQNQTAQAASR